MTYPTWITPGRRYCLRNGWIVKVTGPISIRFGPQHRFTWTGIKGTGPRGREMCWESNGAHHADGAHEFDIISVHVPKKKKEKK